MEHGEISEIGQKNLTFFDESASFLRICLILF